MRELDGVAYMPRTAVAYGIPQLRVPAGSRDPDDMVVAGQKAGEHHGRLTGSSS
jgi:hypothetical protein